MTWLVFHRLFLLVAGSCALYFCLKSRKYLIAIPIIGLVLFSLHDFRNWPKLVEQYYFIDNAQVVSIDIFPINSPSPYIETIGKTYSIKDMSTLIQIEHELKRAESTKLQHPEVTKTFKLQLNTRGDSYDYIVKMTTNQGILFTIFINDYYYFNLKGDRIVQMIHNSTGDQFFVNDR